MIKWIIIILSALTLGGCAILPPYRAMYQTDNSLDVFFQNLQNQDYAASYQFFTDELKRDVSLEKHSKFMNLLHQELGDIKRHKVVIPYTIIPILDEDILKNPYRNDGSVFMRYLLWYENASKPIEVGMEIFKKDNNYRINAFRVNWDGLPSEEDLRNKARFLEIDI